MLDDIRRYLKDDLVSLALFLLLLFGGFFGMVNWSSHTRPSPPYKSFTENDQSYAVRVAHYEQQMATVGQDAVIPWVYAVPLTFTCFAGAIVLLVITIRRHCD